MTSHKVTFKTPPSEKVEIEATCVMNRMSTDANIYASLSDQDASTGYNSIGVTHEYDFGAISFSDDEIDDGVYTAKWTLDSSVLASVGSSNTFWVAFATGNTKTVYLSYGTRASHSLTYPPFIIKAIALPETIYDGQ